MRYYTLILFVFVCFFTSCDNNNEKVEYYSSGEIHRKWNEIDGLKDGTYTEYYKDGQIKLLQIWDSGKIDGIEKAFHGNGEIAQEINYLNGKKVGEAKFYLESGVLIENQSYDSSGNLIGFTQYQSNGNRVQNSFLLVNINKDTVKLGGEIKIRTFLANLLDDRFNKGTLIISKNWEGNKPKDTLEIIKSENNNYEFKVRGDSIGNNQLRGCVYYNIPLDTMDATLKTRKCFTQEYYVHN